MGLDQYATARKGEGTIAEDGYTHYKDSFEIAYWRKHPNLQGWMEDLWIAKGAEGGVEFNCVDLELDEEDLDKLEESLDSKELPETTGFFFGSNADDDYAEKDREFITQARTAIKRGYTIVYYSWW